MKLLSNCLFYGLVLIATLSASDTSSGYSDDSLNKHSESPSLLTSSDTTASSHDFLSAAYESERARAQQLDEKARQLEGQLQQTQAALQQFNKIVAEAEAQTSPIDGIEEIAALKAQLADIQQQFDAAKTECDAFKDMMNGMHDQLSAWQKRSKADNDAFIGALTERTKLEEQLAVAQENIVAMQADLEDSGHIAELLASYSEELEHNLALSQRECTSLQERIEVVREQKRRAIEAVKDEQATLNQHYIQELAEQCLVINQGSCPADF